MKLLAVENVHHAFQLGMSIMARRGKRMPSRGGEVLSYPEPVTTIYENPNQRVIFWPTRDANPFFHFMEGLWMLAGRNDVAWISQFSSNIAQFSDDEKTFHGAYGYRWINHFLANEDDGETTILNQLEIIANMLKANPRERRCVLQMWDASEDLGRVGRDVPCNTQIYFKLSHDNKLDMTVTNRSNDLIWGAYGANAVHMSMLQEVMAAWIGVPIGRYWQVSNDWHAYVDVFEKHKDVIGAAVIQPYTNVSPYPMVNTDIESWFSELDMFMAEGSIIAFKDPFFRRVVNPIYNAWFVWQNKQDKNRIDNALQELQSCAATDWKLACEEWLERRRK